MNDGPVSQSLRLTLRRIRRRPGVALLIVLTMAVGVAPASAIFTVVRGVLLRRLPYSDPTSLVAVEEYRGTHADAGGGVAFANLERYRRATSLEALTAFSYSEFVVSGDGDAERFIGANVDAALLATLGVHTQLGRGIGAGDVGDNPAHVVVLSFAIFRRRYGGDSKVVGRSITIDGMPYTVIGVMPEGFEFPRNPAMDRDVELWVPRRPVPPMMARRGIRDLTVIARIRGNPATATRELVSIAQQAEREDPSNRGWSVRTIALQEMIVGRVRPTLVMLALCVAVLLLIACVNASAAAIARATIERRSLGIQLALGAKHARLSLKVALEMTLFALGAFALAVPLSAVLRGILVRLAPVAIPRQTGIVIDGTVLLFSAVVAVVTGLTGAAGPIIWLKRLDPSALVGDATRSSTGSRGRARALSLFVTAQTALGTALVGLTFVAYQAFALLNRIDPGFDARGVVTAAIPLRGTRYRTGEARSLLIEQLLMKVRALPGVEFASMGSLMPLSGGLMSGTYRVKGQEADSSARAMLRAISSDFFSTLGMPLRGGRPILATDKATTLPVVVVNEAFVRRALAGTEAVGRQLLITPPSADSAQSFEIVGVVGDAKETDLAGSPSPIIYFSDQQASFPHTVLAVRFRGAAPVDAIRRSLRNLDPTLALDEPRLLIDRVRATYALQVYLLRVLELFAASAAFLIAVGVYGTVSYAVASERRAIGIRVAMGATSGKIVRLLVMRTMVACAVGSLVGLPACVAITQRYVPLKEASAPLVSALAAIGVIALAIAATLGPAIRASRMDPLTVLHE